MDTSHSFMIILSLTLLHGGCRTFFGTVFKKNDLTFERLMILLITAMVGDLKTEFVVEARDSCCTMKELDLKTRRLELKLSGLYATEDRFDHSNRLFRSQQESRIYFSGKNRLYGYKTKVSVSPNGLSIFTIPHISESKSDLAIFGAMSEENKNFHSQAIW